MNIAKFLRTPISKNICKRLLLILVISKSLKNSPEITWALDFRGYAKLRHEFTIYFSGKHFPEIYQKEPLTLIWISFFVNYFNIWFGGRLHWIKVPNWKLKSLPRIDLSRIPICWCQSKIRNNIWRNFLAL